MMLKRYEKILNHAVFFFETSFCTLGKRLGEYHEKRVMYDDNLIPRVPYDFQHGGRS